MPRLLGGADQSYTALEQSPEAVTRQSVGMSDALPTTGETHVVQCCVVLCCVVCLTCQSVSCLAVCVIDPRREGKRWDEPHFPDHWLSSAYMLCTAVT